MYGDDEVHTCPCMESDGLLIAPRCMSASHLANSRANCGTGAVAQKINSTMTLQAKEDATELQEKSKGMKKDIEAAGQRVVAAAAARDAALLTIGNFVHDSVPVDDDEASNSGFPSPRCENAACECKARSPKSLEGQQCLI